MTYIIGPTNREVLLPDPAPEDVRYTVISVDDHLVEPPDMFDARLPARLQVREMHRIRWIPPAGVCAARR